MNFELNPESACAVATSTQITETGAYDGIITQAYELHAKSGAVGIDFTFKAKSGATCSSQLWLCKEGRTYFGRKILDALMVVLGVKACNSERGVYFDQRHNRQMGDVFPCLCEKPVGLLLQRQERQYIGRNGEVQTAFQMNIVTPYDVTTRRIASEVLGGAVTGKALEKRIATTHDIPAKPIDIAPKVELSTKAEIANEDAMPF